jgi:hypothetical protein
MTKTVLLFILFIFSIVISDSLQASTVNIVPQEMQQMEKKLQQLTNDCLAIIKETINLHDVRATHPKKVFRQFETKTLSTEGRKRIKILAKNEQSDPFISELIREYFKFSEYCLNSEPTFEQLSNTLHLFTSRYQLNEKFSKKRPKFNFTYNGSQYSYNSNSTGAFIGWLSQYHTFIKAASYFTTVQLKGHLKDGLEYLSDKKENSSEVTDMTPQGWQAIAQKVIDEQKEEHREHPENSLSPQEQELQKRLAELIEHKDALKKELERAEAKLNPPTQSRLPKVINGAALLTGGCLFLYGKDMHSLAFLITWIGLILGQLWSHIYK